MSHTVSGTPTNYTWDVNAGLPVVLQDGTNTYVYGLDLISATDGAGAQTYFTYDGLGSATDLTNGSGTVTDTYSYDVFGALRASTGSSANPWRFTGEQRDADSGMYFLRARYYDPATGRFVGKDPLNIGNRYSYVGNNPANLVDPLGLCGWKDAWNCADDAVGAGGDAVEDAYQAGDDVVGAAEDAGDWVIDTASTYSTVVSIMDLFPATHWYVEVANGFLTQLSIFTSDCSIATKIQLSLMNALNIGVGAAGTALIVPAFGVAGPVGSGAVITVTFVVEASLTTANQVIIDGCTNVAYADAPGSNSRRGSKE